METRQLHVRDLSTVRGIQQYEHCVQSIFFLGLEDFEGTIYLSIESDEFNEDIALTNNTFIIGQPMTKFNTTYTCQIYGIVGTGTKIQLSKQFRMMIDKSNNISGEAGEYPIDPNLVNGIDQYVTQKEADIDDYVEQVIDSIPSDYTELEARVDELEQGSGSFSDSIKQALLNCFRHVAWSDSQGAYYVNLLETELYSNEWIVTNDLTGCTNSNQAGSVTKNGRYTATITPSIGYTLAGASVSITMGGVDITSSAYSNGSINIASVTGALVITIEAEEYVAVIDHIGAVFTQAGAVFDTDSLESLRNNLVVTGYYDNDATVVLTEYTLSGSLTAGTSTITVVYGGKTTTFNVTVTSMSNIAVSVAFDQSNLLLDPATGNTSSNSSWKCTDFIEISDSYDWLGWTSDTMSFRGAVYDANKTFMYGLNNNSAMSNVTRVIDEIQSGAKYFRACTIKSNGPASINLRMGHSFIRDTWSSEAIGYIADDGSINYSATTNRQRITDYIPIPSGATRLYWGNRKNQSFKVQTIAVYDSNKNFISLNRGDGTRFIYSPNYTNLTTLTDPAYIRAGVNDNGVSANSDPVTQMVYAYFGTEVS